MSNRLEGIKERLQAAQYAARCAQGGGAFGAVEQGMLEEFQGSAQSDVAWLLEENARLTERISGADLAALVRLGRELAGAVRERDARPEISIKDAAIWTAHPDTIDFSTTEPVEAARRVNDAPPRPRSKGAEPMTVRTLTEIMDIDDDTITLITVGPDEPYCAEIVIGQWATGERDPSRDIRVRLELTDAIALRDALTRCIDASEVIE